MTMNKSWASRKKFEMFKLAALFVVIDAVKGTSKVGTLLI